MRIIADRQAARADGHRQALAVAALELGLAGDGFVDGDVDEMQRAAVRVRRVIRERDFVARNQVRHTVVSVLSPLGIRRAEVGA